MSCMQKLGRLERRRRTGGKNWSRRSSHHNCCYLYLNKFNVFLKNKTLETSMFSFKWPKRSMY